MRAPARTPVQAGASGSLGPPWLRASLSQHAAVVPLDLPADQTQLRLNALHRLLFQQRAGSARYIGQNKSCLVLERGDLVQELVAGLARGAPEGLALQSRRFVQQLVFARRAGLALANTHGFELVGATARAVHARRVCIRAPAVGARALSGPAVR